jgi:putative FmdB family regulatory protein
MPIYEYRCESCSHTLDALQKLSDKPLRKCPECGKSALKRLMSAPSFRLKGGGWYETDFKSDSEKKRNLVDSAVEKPKEGSKPKEDGGTKEKAAGDKKTEAKDPKPSSKTAGKGSGTEAA